MLEYICYVSSEFFFCSLFIIFFFFLVEKLHVWMIIPSGFGSCAAGRILALTFVLWDSSYDHGVTMAKKYCFSYNWK